MLLDNPDDLSFVPTARLIDELKDRHQGSVMIFFNHLDSEREHTHCWYRGPRALLRGLIEEARDRIRNEKAESVTHDDNEPTPS